PRLPNIRWMVCLCAIEPRRCRRIVDPRMIRTGVIGDFILNDLDAESMSLIDEFAEFRQRPEMLFDAIEIDSAVTVIIRNLSSRAVWLIRILLALVEMIDVVIPGREPNRRYAELFQIRQMCNDPFKVATVVITNFRAIVEAG